MMRYRTLKIRVDQRDRLRRLIRNSVLANAAIVTRGLFNSSEEDKTKRIAELVAEDIQAEFRLVRRA